MIGIQKMPDIFTFPVEKDEYQFFNAVEVDCNGQLA